MTVYSDFPGRRVAQITGDVVTAALIVLAVWIGVIVRDAILVLADVGRTLQDAGEGFSGTMTDAGDRLGGVPLIGGGIRVPFDGASDAGVTLAAAGVAQQDAVATVGTVLGVAVALGPIILVLLVWVLTRLRFVLRATELRAISRLAEGADLLALRALTTARAGSLRVLGDSSVQGWRDRQGSAIAALSALGLREGGLRS